MDDGFGDVGAMNLRCVCSVGAGLPEERLRQDCDGPHREVDRLFIRTAIKRGRHRGQRRTPGRRVHHRVQGRSDYESRRRHRHRASPIPTGPIWLRGPAPAALDSSEDELRALLEHVRGGFTRLDAGEIDEFEPGRPDPPLQALSRRALEVLRVERWSVAAGGELAEVPTRPRRGAGLVGAGAHLGVIEPPDPYGGPSPVCRRTPSTGACDGADEWREGFAKAGRALVWAPCQP